MPITHRRSAILPLAVACGLGVAAARLSAQPGAAPEPVPPAGFAGPVPPPSLVGEPIEIDGTLLSGKPFDRKSLAGKVVLVEFWATWCPSCVAEMPNLLAQYEKYHDQGLEIVGVCLDEDREAVKQFVAEQKIPWPILHEEPAGAGWRHPLVARYGISGIPTVILVGRDGTVIAPDIGGETLAAELAAIFKPNR